MCGWSERDLAMNNCDWLIYEELSAATQSANFDQKSSDNLNVLQILKFLKWFTITSHKKKRKAKKN